ncbi:leucyl aminopeptidase family protein [Brucella rhizosphaerae]|uniref:leucyl aminopeptidase family protein n=1 Tax=Brucella rhizosphaerae TaxID=571254 RepID=UPI00360B3343
MNFVLETYDENLVISDNLQAAPYGAATRHLWEKAPENGEVEAAWVISPDGKGHRLFALGLDAFSQSGDYRDCGMRLGRLAADAPTIAVDLLAFSSPNPNAIGALCEGIALGNFKPATRSDQTLRLILPKDVDQTAYEQAAQTGFIIAHWTNWARDLVERPAADLWPEALAQEIAKRAANLGISAEIWDETRMEAEGFGATLAVGRGADAAPRVVILRCGSGDRPIGLAGKGVTFDTGGLNLKRDPQEIGYMKSDMAGAVAVAGALFAAVELNKAPDVLAVLPMAENMPSGRAMRPGDRVRHPDNSTTEVMDTDSEGRLLLADALSWLNRQKVRALIDVGTLSDGGGVGPEFWGTWSNTANLAARLTSAGDDAGDPGWHLPLRNERGTLLRSRIANRSNVASDEPDSGQIAACYLSQFVGQTEWAHIDNGSTAWLLRDTGPWPEGATGAPLRALTQFLCNEKP